MALTEQQKEDIGEATLTKLLDFVSTAHTQNASAVERFFASELSDTPGKFELLVVKARELKSQHDDFAAFWAELKTYGDTL